MAEYKLSYTAEEIDSKLGEIDNKADKSEGAFFVVGSGTTDSTNKVSTWTGTSDRVTEYYDGLTIRYKIGVAGQSTTTLNINGLGAKTIYLFNTTKLTTQFPVNSIINLIYHADLNSGCWVCSDYDSNTNTYQRVYPTTTNTEYPITTRYNTTTGSSYYAEYGRYSTGVTLNPSTNTITATKFNGALAGNADTATRATQDASGNVITSTYETKTDAATKLSQINAQISELSSEKDDLTERVDELEDDVLSIQAQALQQTPLFANSIEELEESGDTTKLYVLPDGYIYAHVKTVTEGETVPNFTDLVETGAVTIYENTRYSASSQAFKTDAVGHYALVFQLPTSADITQGVDLRITYSGFTSGEEYATYFGTSATVFNSGFTASWTVESDGICKATKTLSDGSFKWVVIHLKANKLIGSIDDVIITVNEKIAYTTTPGGVTYQWANTGHAFVPANYESRIVSAENTIEEHDNRISELENEITKPKPTGIVTMFISPTGNDNNDGLTVSKPKKTVKACVDAGATIISAKRGIYNEQITLSNIDTLEILPTDNDYTFDANVKRYPPIVFDTSYTIPVSSLSAYNSIKKVAYAESNKALAYVFTNGLYDKVYSTSHGYHAVLWAITGNIKNDFKLRPMATIAEVEATTNSFTWVNNVLYLNANFTDVTEIKVPTIYDNAITVFTANKVKLTDVEVRFAGRYSILIENCPDVSMDNCSVKYTSNGSGFDFKNVNGTLRNCYASRVHDGYGIGDYGHTIFIDCVAEWCFDDGMSHHRGCTGTVIGGRYEGNVKAGNCPAHGANVNIYGGLYKDNKTWGIAYWYENTYNPCTGMVQGATMVGNPKGLVVDAGSSVTALNCHYVNNTVDKDITGTLIEY